MLAGAVEKVSLSAATSTCLTSSTPCTLPPLRVPLFAGDTPLSPQLMNNESISATVDDEIIAYTDPDHDPEGQRTINLVSDTWYPGTCEVRYCDAKSDFSAMKQRGVAKIGV